MKIALLTSDSIDGKIVLRALLKANKNIAAVIYEKVCLSFKALLKQYLFFLSGRISCVRYETLLTRIPGLKVLKTDSVNDESSVSLLRTLQVDLLVVVGTKRIKEEVLRLSSLGAMNLHSGILPFYRGADSEFWALMHNEPDMVGVTIHYVNERLDAGDVIVSSHQAVMPSDTSSSLRKRNIYLGASKMIEAIDAIASEKLNRRRQDESLSRVFKSAARADKLQLSRWHSIRKQRRSLLKSFKAGALTVNEEVAEIPLIECLAGRKMLVPSTFCLRIDADEFHPGLFPEYKELFRNFAPAITMFVNAQSFGKAKNEVLACRDAGIDIQSHAYYHYVYNDYRSNRYNIHKAKVFFEELRIPTRGFAAPMGAWNPALMSALEAEGYEYSSDFAYDYSGFPSYPVIRNIFSKVLEIPVFPVAPELFCENNKIESPVIFDYYRRVIDSMIACGIPVIVYAHTSHIPGIAALLKRIVEYAILERKLVPCSMTRFADWWKHRRSTAAAGFPVAMRPVTALDPVLQGEKAIVSHRQALKRKVKRAIDFERITPDQELCCPEPGRSAKILLRRLLKQR